MWRKDPLKVRELNDRLMMAERAFTDSDGLPGRPSYKHLVSLFMSITGLIRCYNRIQWVTGESFKAGSFLIVLNMTHSLTGPKIKAMACQFDLCFGRFLRSKFRSR